jgi:hypothetical protein
VPAKVRTTDIASVLESFLDSNEEDLSPNMFAALEDVASEIEDMAKELEKRISDLEDEL